MSTNAEAYYAQSRENVMKVKGSAPAVANCFGSFYQSMMKPGELSVREKELVAMGIGLAMRCEGCIYAHVRGAMKSGATRAQIVEAAGVAVMMQGGPTYTYLPKLIDALDAVESEAAAGAARADGGG
jgi:AhpD family alkylhydroperoxidase